MRAQNGFEDVLYFFWIFNEHRGQILCLKALGHHVVDWEFFICAHASYLKEPIFIIILNLHLLKSVNKKRFLIPFPKKGNYINT